MLVLLVAHRSPLLKSPPVVRGPGDARHDILRREAERRELMERRLGVDPYLRERERQVHEGVAVSVNVRGAF